MTRGTAIDLGIVGVAIAGFVILFQAALTGPPLPGVGPAATMLTAVVLGGALIVGALLIASRRAARRIVSDYATLGIRPRETPGFFLQGNFEGRWRGRRVRISSLPESDERGTLVEVTLAQTADVRLHVAARSPRFSNRLSDVAPLHVRTGDPAFERTLRAFAAKPEDAVTYFDAPLRAWARGRPGLELLRVEGRVVHLALSRRFPPAEALAKDLDALTALATRAEGACR